jgi:hypothetical protein
MQPAHEDKHACLLHFFVPEHVADGGGTLLCVFDCFYAFIFGGRCCICLWFVLVHIHMHRMQHEAEYVMRMRVHLF